MNGQAARQDVREARPVETPAKLRDDAIVEAVCLLQFECRELPEVIIGRLSDAGTAQGFEASRLPIADIPFPLRNSDPNLMFQPTLALKAPDGSRIVQIGERVLSYHVVGAKRYCGWPQFKKELGETFKDLFEKLSKIEVRKISFRYVNALVANRHFIGGVHELNLKVFINEHQLDCPINLNYVFESGVHSVTTRVAHMSFVQVQGGGSLPPGTTAIVDVEVTTPAKYNATNLGAALEWIEEAHTLEKQAFFKLIPRETLEKLTEDQK
jgi:uncharacterized protein (TIGR04255 family)